MRHSRAPARPCDEATKAGREVAVVGANGAQGRIRRRGGPVPGEVPTMRAVFGVVSLLVVLAVVALTARQQLRAVAPAPLTAPASQPGSPPITPAQASKQMQQQVQRDIDAALQQGATRNDDAEKAVK